MTITSTTLILAVFLGMAWALAKLQDRKIQALSFFRFVRMEQTFSMIKNCGKFLDHIQSTSRKKVRRVNMQIVRISTSLLDQTQKQPINCLLYTSDAADE